MKKKKVKKKRSKRKENKVRSKPCKIGRIPAHALDFLKESTHAIIP